MIILRRAVLSVTVILMTAGCIVYSAEVSGAVTDALKRCAVTIIPSLFAFMALSRLFISTGSSGMILRPFDRLFSILLGLPEHTSAIFVISNIAGYPVGCAMLREMAETGQIDKRNAEVMSIYCFGAGPAFMINAIGGGIFGNRQIGVCLFLSAISTNIMLALMINRIYRPEIKQNDPNDINYFSEALISSVTNAGEDILRMCAVIVFFSAALAVMEGFGIIALISGIFDLSRNETVIVKSLFEITNLSGISTNSYKSLPYISALCCFGGVCVIMQLRSVIGKSFSMKLFLKWMPVKAVLGYVFMKIYSRLILSDNLPAFVKSDDLIVRIDNFAPSICLIMMIFVLLFQKRVDFLKRV